MRLARLIPLVIAIGCLTAPSGQAATIFTENFNSPTGQNQNALQVTTNFQVAFGGSYAGWTNSGTSTAHLVNRSNSGNWAPMFWQGPTTNVMTSPSVAAGNSAGQIYSINFDLAPAVYANIAQATVTGDGIVVDVLNSANTVIASRPFYPGSFASQAAAGSLPYAPITMYYSGNGSGTGAASLRFSSTNPSGGHFGGSVDNVSLNTLSGLPSGAVLLSENFNNPTGQNQNAIQATTGFPVSFGANFADWTKGGLNSVHLVNLGGGNQAAMFYDGSNAPQNNVITSAPFGAGNLLGQLYSVSFDLGAANYNGAQGNNGTTDGIVVEVLDSLNNIIATQTFIAPGFSTATAGNLPFQPILMSYFGNGLGNGSAMLRISSNNAGANRFGGSVDNLLVTALAVPEPGAIAIWMVGGFGLLACLRRRVRRGNVAR